MNMYYFDNLIDTLYLHVFGNAPTFTVSFNLEYCMIDCFQIHVSVFEDEASGQKLIFSSLFSIGQQTVHCNFLILEEILPQLCPPLS